HGDCLTWLHARLPRVACPQHGIRQIRIPWALPGCRLTIPFERHAIDGLLQADVLGGAGLLRLSWDEAWNIMERAVARGQRAKKHMTEAVDTVRKWEHRRLQAEGDETRKETKYLWLYSEENLPESAAEKFAALRGLHLKTGRAWAIKESLRDLWEYRRRGWAMRHWRHWYFWATHSRLKPVIKVARMIHGRLENVLTYLDHRITTATCEGLNSKIQTIKKTPMASAIGSI